MNTIPSKHMILEHQKHFTAQGKLLPFGVYDGLFGNTATKEWDTDGFLLKRRRTQRKCWLYFGAFSKDLFTGMAIVDAGMVATAFAYFYIPSEKLFVEDKITLPLGFKDSFDPHLFDSWNLGNFDIHSDGKKMKLSCKGKFNSTIETKENESGLSFLCPSKERPFNFTYKNLLLDSKINIEYKGKKYTSEGAIGSIDFSKGYPPRETVWNWASIIGTTENGLPIGINLVDGHNGNLENAIWIGEERLCTSKANFYVKKPFDKNTWNINTTDGIIDFQFNPYGARSENLNIVAMKSLFTQPFGEAKGILKHNGHAVSFNGFGVVEDHIAVW